MIFLLTFWESAMENSIFLIITLTEFQIEHGWQICVWLYCLICFIVNSIDTDEFQEYVTSKLGEREEKILEKQHFTMNVDKNIAKIFSGSQMVSGMFLPKPRPPRRGRGLKNFVDSKNTAPPTLFLNSQKTVK